MVRKFLASDLVYGLTSSFATQFAVLVCVLMVSVGLLAPYISPHDPLDLTSINLLDAELPPSWLPDGEARFLIGTDNQGRDLTSLILYGLRISLIVGMLSIAFAMLIGVTIGLCAGYFGGTVDIVLMRIADIQLSFPAILVALLIDGVAHAALPPDLLEDVMMAVLVCSIGLSQWVLFARTVRSVTMVEKNKEYVMAAQILGVASGKILFKHILPNAMGSILVIATINLAVAILLEATLSFLGVGLPPTSPSLGTLIRIGNEYLFSGLWWVAIFPGVTLVILVLSVNVVGDALRDIFNPKLK